MWMSIRSTALSRLAYPRIAIVDPNVDLPISILFIYKTAYAQYESSYFNIMLFVLIN